MTKQYLIAHKVRGQPAFDIAEQSTCPECIAGTVHHEGFGTVCAECDGEGFWWIVSTSGHRAYPWWNWPLEATELNGGGNTNLIDMAGTMPEGLPDHYPTNPSPATPSLLARLGLIRKEAKVTRR